MNPKAKNSCAERRAPSKIEQAGCPETIWKKILEDKQYYRRWVSISHRFPQRAKNFTDVGRRYEFERGKIKYTKAVNVFGLVTKSWQSKLTIKRYEKHSKRQGARANHPKQPALPERRAPRAEHPTRAPKADCPTRAPSAVLPFFQSKQTLGGFIPTRGEGDYSLFSIFFTAEFSHFLSFRETKSLKIVTFLKGGQ